jgi:GT2 family glycosyltransferase
MSQYDLSVIIVSFNTANLLIDCITHLENSLDKTWISYEIIVVDNNSTDGSLEKIEELQLKNKNIALIKNPSNKGFGAANNIGIKKAQGNYVLLLNSDVIINEINWKDIIAYLEAHKKVGVLTVDVVLPSGARDMACHRGFPTIWRSFTYFSGLEKTLGHIPYLARIFGAYHLLDKNFKKIHEIDSPTGAFFLTRKSILDEVGGFDEDYFMYGEDLDLSYRIKEKGYSIIFYPLDSVIHLKNQSGIKNENRDISINTKKYFFTSMQIFYDKHYAQHHSPIMNKIISFFIHLKTTLS